MRVNHLGDIPGGSAVKESACQPRRHRDVGSVPRPGRFPGEGNGNPLHYMFAWIIPWIEESGRLQSMGLQRVRRDLGTNTTTK